MNNESRPSQEAGYGSKARRYAREAANLLLPVREHQKLNRWVKPLNWVLPIGEGWSFFTSVTTSGKTLWHRYKAAVQERKEREANLPELSYRQALAASGMTQAELLARYTWQKRTWLVFCSLPVAFLSLIACALFIMHPPASLFLVVRTVSLLMSMLALSSAFFILALKCEYRRWQLREQRVSASEHGTFSDFTRERRWVRETLISNITKGTRP